MGGRDKYSVFNQASLVSTENYYWSHRILKENLIYNIYIYIYIYIYHHTTCESTYDTLTSSAANQGYNTVSVAEGGTATPGAIMQLLPPDRVFKRNIYLYIHKIN